jgi:hypothetical protein
MAAQLAVLTVAQLAVLTVAQTAASRAESSVEPTVEKWACRLAHSMVGLTAGLMDDSWVDLMAHLRVDSMVDPMAE